ncbi:hypothetical protein BR93DRAFT_688294 [Coniochaeta sp. PMI_546]|nr:hypothetical protein BR93DRAFT_688294 [Coniochaeta sp. PMI_546]
MKSNARSLLFRCSHRKRPRFETCQLALALGLRCQLHLKNVGGLDIEYYVVCVISRRSWNCGSVDAPLRKQGYNGVLMLYLGEYVVRFCADITREREGV